MNHSTLYITEPDNGELVDIVQAFERDFQNGTTLNGIGDLVEHLCQGNETVTLKRLEDGGGYSVQIARLAQLHDIPGKGLKNRLFGKIDYIREVPHPVDISALSIRHDDEYGYMGSLTFYDSGHDLNDFAIAIDGTVYKEGTFVKRGSMGLLGEQLANKQLTFEINDQPLDVKAENLFMGCMADHEGGLWSHSSSGIGKFGDIPSGNHELTFYVRDKRGSRSFAVTEYNI